VGEEEEEEGGRRTEGRMMERGEEGRRGG